MGLSEKHIGWNALRDIALYVCVASAIMGVVWVVASRIHDVSVTEEEHVTKRTESIVECVKAGGSPKDCRDAVSVYEYSRIE